MLQNSAEQKYLTRFSDICEEFDKRGIEIFGSEIAENVIEEE